MASAHETHDDHDHGHDAHGHDDHGHDDHHGDHGPADDKWVLAPIIVGIVIGIAIVALLGVGTGASPVS